MSMEDLDFLDVGTGILSVCVVASAPTPLIALPLVALWTVQHLGRRSKAMQDWSDTITDRNKIAAKVMPLLLPPAQTSTEVTLRQDAPLDVRVTNEPKKLSWGESITQRPASKVIGSAEVKTKKVTVREQQQNDMAEILAKMPKYIPYQKTPDAPTPTSVLVGYDAANRKWMWIDFGLDGNTIHAFVAGQTGAGKDSELRLWFTQLTSNNTPEDIKFIVLDGGGEWLTPALIANPFMLVPPVGGIDLQKNEKGKYVDKANEAIEQSLETVFELIAERNRQFQKVGATNVQTYQKKTGRKLPLIFIVATDVGTNFEGQLEMLIRTLAFKGRSFGMRLIISMQTASGQDTGWRGQLAFAMSGFQSQPSADTPNMGIPVAALRYRPSQLPSPDNPDYRGIFVVRKGSDQYLIKTIHLPDEVFETYCENNADTTPHTPEYSLLNDLLSAAPELPKQKLKQPKKILTKEQIEQVIMLTRDGMNKTQLMHHLGVTSGERYKEVSPVVDGLMALAKSKR